MRLTDFWSRLSEAFGPGYAASIAADQVLPQARGYAEICRGGAASVLESQAELI